METDQKATGAKRTGVFTYRYVGPILHPTRDEGSPTEWSKIERYAGSVLDDALRRMLAREHLPLVIPDEVYRVTPIPTARPDEGGNRITVLFSALVTYRSWQDCAVGDFVADIDLPELHRKDSDYMDMFLPSFSGSDLVGRTVYAPARYSFEKQGLKVPGSRATVPAWSLNEIHVAGDGRAPT